MLHLLYQEESKQASLELTDVCNKFRILHIIHFTSAHEERKKNNNQQIIVPSILFSCRQILYYNKTFHHKSNEKPP